MKYKDLHGAYACRFAQDGSYTFTSSREGERAEVRSGKYQWQVLGKGKAILKLEDETYTLTFTSPSKATGTVEDDVRVYTFSFEK